ncbi:MAG: hypothetical protein ACKV2O_20845 [Acidimicrobiales bacterium]
MDAVDLDPDYAEWVLAEASAEEGWMTLDEMLDALDYEAWPAESA